MAKQVIDIGAKANDNTGTPIRDAFDMVNDNFTEVYADNFVTNARMADDSVKAAELSTTNAAGSGIDNYILSYDHSSGGFTWVVQSTPDGGLIVSNPANNRVITSTGGSTGDAEANLTFDGTNLVAGGNGSSGGVTVSDGSIQMRTGTGNVAEIRMYCESSNAHYQTIKAQPHSAASSAVLTLPSATGTLVGTGDSNSVSHAMIADNAVDHDELANRYTAVVSKSEQSGTGGSAVDISWDDGSVFKFANSLTGAIELKFDGYKAGQIISIYNLTGTQTITLNSTASGTEVFNKVGGVDYAGGSVNLLQVECVDDSASTPTFNYSVAAYVSDATPS